MGVECVTRMGKAIYKYTILVAKTHWKRPYGAPTGKWGHNINMNFTKTGYENMN
jgi:hypothetical protein